MAGPLPKAHEAKLEPFHPLGREQVRELDEIASGCLGELHEVLGDLATAVAGGAAFDAPEDLHALVKQIGGLILSLEQVREICRGPA